MSFEIFGPFNLIDEDGATVDATPKRQAAFWQEVEAREPGLSAAFGCFLFSCLSRGHSTPWYVGMATDKPFQEVCFSSQAKKCYRKARKLVPSATPHLLLVPIRSERQEFVIPERAHRAELRAMETCLVGLSMNRNPDLLNQGLERYRKYAAAGELVQVRSKSTIDQRAFRQVLGLV